MKRIIVILFSAIAVLAFSFTGVMAMSTHTDSLSYDAGTGPSRYGYSSQNYKGESANQYSTKLTGVGFIGLPAGTFPNSSTNIYFTPVDTSYSGIAPRNYHNSTHLAYGTIKHDTYYEGYRGSGFNVILRVHSNNTSMGNTVGVKWNLGYVNYM